MKTEKTTINKIHHLLTQSKRYLSIDRGLQNHTIERITSHEFDNILLYLF